jgi:hypothetical protein
MHLTGRHSIGKKPADTDDYVMARADALGPKTAVLRGLAMHRPL